MTQIHTTLISADALAQALTTGKPMRIFDCRARLGEPAKGYELFTSGHIRGALHADLDRHLAQPPGAQGRHPLPAIDSWLEQVRSFGVKNHEQVILYDDAGGQMAARGWWMFRWLGHQATAVLDGGLGQWLQELENGSGAQPEPSNFQAQPALTKLWQVTDVIDNLQHKTHILVDARAVERFRGQQEPIDPVAGHIPDAVCLPCSDNLTPSGLFKTAPELAQRFQHLSAASAVCYCGSGVTATHNILAMRVGGLPEPALYADSWSGWITDSSRPIAQGYSEAPEQDPELD